MPGSDLLVLTIKFPSVYWTLLATQAAQNTLIKVDGFMFSLITKIKYIKDIIRRVTSYFCADALANFQVAK